MNSLSLGEQRQRGRGVPAWAGVTGGSGLALTGVGIYFFADNLKAINRLRSSCHTNATSTHCAPGCDIDRNNSRKDHDFALGLAVGGVLALGAAVFGLFRAPLSKASAALPAALTAAPRVAADHAGAIISGRF